MVRPEGPSAVSEAHPPAATSESGRDDRLLGDHRGRLSGGPTGTGRIVYVVYEYPVWKGDRDDLKRAAGAGVDPCRHRLHRCSSAATENMLRRVRLAAGRQDHLRHRRPRPAPHETGRGRASALRPEPYKGAAQMLKAIPLVRERATTCTFECFGRYPGLWRVGGLTMLGTVTDAAARRTLTRRRLVFVSPSYAEGWGLTSAEAMANGAALVVTDDGGSRRFRGRWCRRRWSCHRGARRRSRMLVCARRSGTTSCEDAWWRAGPGVSAGDDVGPVRRRLRAGTGKLKLAYPSAGETREAKAGQAPRTAQARCAKRQRAQAEDPDQMLKNAEPGQLRRPELVMPVRRAFDKRAARHERSGEQIAARSVSRPDADKTSRAEAERNNEHGNSAERPPASLALVRSHRCHLRSGIQRGVRSQCRRRQRFSPGSEHGAHAVLATPTMWRGGSGGGHRTFAAVARRARRDWRHPCDVSLDICSSWRPDLRDERFDDHPYVFAHWHAGVSLHASCRSSPRGDRGCT